MTATERVINYLSDHGPATTSEIAQALSKEYGVGTVRRAVSELKRKGTLVDTGLRHKTPTKPEHILALARELERARASHNALMEHYSGSTNDEIIESIFAKPTFIQRVKRWFGGK